MPSIRIKGTSYAALQDGAAANEPRSLAEIFPSNSPGSPTLGNRVSPRRSMPVMRETDNPTSIPASPEILSQSPRQRRRAGTVSSRIYHHVVHKAPRIDPADHDSQPSTSRTASPLLVGHDGSHMVTLEGSQADIRMRASTERGRVDSAINLPHTHYDANHVALLNSMEAHHDDIVEHLDVIGEFRLSLPFRMTTDYFLQTPRSPLFQL